jgi:hypothetical protein
VPTLLETTFRKVSRKERRNTTRLELGYSTIEAAAVILLMVDQLMKWRCRMLYIGPRHWSWTWAIDWVKGLKLLLKGVWLPRQLAAGQIETRLRRRLLSTGTGKTIGLQFFETVSQNAKILIMTEAMIGQVLVILWSAVIHLGKFLSGNGSAACFFIYCMTPAILIVSSVSLLLTVTLKYLNYNIN